MAKTGKQKKEGSLTPMMRQYQEVRRGLPPNTLLLFRLGDFYEMFLDDAATGAPIMGIALTKRHGMPMAGIPYHAVDNYIGKLLAAGKKVAICDQMEAPQPGKIVKRALTRILSPGTTLEDHQSNARTNNFLLAVDWEKSTLQAAWLDLSTGYFQIASDPSPENLLAVFSSIHPREIIIPEEAANVWKKDESLQSWADSFFQFCQGRPVNELPAYHFDQPGGAQSVMDALGVINLQGFGIAAEHGGLGPAGALIHYATESLCSKPGNLRGIKEYRTARTLLLDPATLRNLEIFRSSQNRREGSLLEAMDATVTAAGARLLEQYLAEPTLNLEEVKRRQNCVGDFLQGPAFASEIQEYMKGIRDIPRILGRLQNRIRNPRELGGIRDTLRQIPLILQVLGQFDEPGLEKLAGKALDYPQLRELLEKSLAEELPNQLKDGGYIRDGFDESLDRLRGSSLENKNWLSDLEREERERTGIKKLRIKYNRAFGYFIEVTKINLDLVPDHYIRKQTTTNAERYYTEDLKQKEKEILHSDERSIAREEELFRNLVAHVLAEAESLAETARALAEIDLYIGWSKIAREWDYCRPEMDDSSLLQIEVGRHPVIEQTIRKERYGLAGARAFVPNDAFLSAEKDQIGIITGPNMAGKSTYIRQVALITLMAQTGSWTPARKCRIGLVDRIFSRIGASDELSRGNSTFMVEMNETANIINNVTDKSLVILDEIGRGTSTYDGMSIAWAVVEHLHGEKIRGPRTLFATHYHELTRLEQLLPRVCNYCVAVKEWNDEIVFVRQVLRGASDRSYGIQVARLAGLPQKIIDRAKVLLEQLEADDSSHNLAADRKGGKRSGVKEPKQSWPQMELF